MASITSTTDFNKFPVFIPLDNAITERLKEAISFYENKYLKLIFNATDLKLFNDGVSIAYTELRAIFKEAFPYVIFFHFVQKNRILLTGIGQQQAKPEQTENTFDPSVFVDNYNSFVDVMIEANEFMKTNSIQSNQWEPEKINAYNI